VWSVIRGGRGRKSLKVFKVEVSHFWRVLAIFLLKLCLKLIASEEKKRKISVSGIQKIGPRSLGYGFPGSVSVTRC